MGGLYKIVGMIVWLITALASINVGLTLFNMNVLGHPFVINNMPWAIVPAYYVIGISGIISLAMMFFHGCCGSCSGCHKGKGQCTC